jgi:hypothetical protein
MSKREPAPFRVPYAVSPQFEDYLTHPILFDQFIWDPTAISVVLSNDIFQDYLLLLAAIDTKYKKFSYATGKLCFRIVVQGQSFSYGQIVYACDPRPSTPNVISSNFASVQKPRSKIVPHITIDPSKDATYEIELLPPAPHGVWTVDAAFNVGSYQISQVIWNVIASGSATAPGVVVSMFLYMKEPSFQAMTLLSGELKESGVLSSTLRTMSKVASMAAPVFGPAATTISEVLHGASSVFSWFGFSKPNIVDVVLPSLNRTVDNYSQTDSRSSSYKLADSSINSLGISTGYLPLGDADDQIISKLCCRPCLTDQFLIQPTAAAESVLTSFFVHPSRCFVLDNPSIKNGYELTTLAHCSCGFNRWSGDISYTFEFVASVFQRATILIAWDPSTTTVASVNTAMYQLPHEIIQVSGNTSVEILIPWRQEEPTLACTPPNGYGTTNSNGQIWVFLVNPVTSNGSTSPIYMNVYAHSDNIRFAVPTLTNVAYCAPVLTSGELVPSQKVSFGKPTDLSDFDLRYFGEAADRTFKSYASRMSPAYVSSATGTAVVGDIVASSLIVDPSPLYTSSPVASGAVGVSFYAWAALGYLGTRGSICYSQMTPIVSGYTPTDFRIAVFAPDYVSKPYVSSISAYTIGESLLGVYNIASNFHIGYTKVHPNLDVTMPHYFPYLYRIINAGASALTGNLYEAVQFTDIGIATSTTLTNQSAIMVGLGDDGQFVFYRGCPTAIYA